MLVRTLGVLTVETDAGGMGGADLGGRRARVALATLALEHTAVSPERLAEALWPDDPPATWAVAVRGAIRELRQRLGVVGMDEAVTTVGHGYRTREDVHTDLDVGEREVELASRLFAQGRYVDVLDLVTEAARWRPEDLLPDETAELWRRHRARVESVSLRAQHLVVEAAGALGRHDSAVDQARNLVARTPLDESAHRALIAALGRAGNRAEAVLAYESCRSLLVEELGVEPSETTVQAYLALLGEPSSLAGVKVPASESTFVGRASELSRLRDLLSAPGLVSVTGRGGVGKSRLAAEAARRATVPPECVWWVSLAHTRDDALVASTVAMRLQAPTDGVDAAADLIRYCAAAGRTMLVLDGCEAARDGTGSLVTALLAGCPSLTVVVTSRVPLRILEETTVEVGPLVEVETLMRDRLRAGGGDPDVVRRDAPAFAELFTRCAGLPLAVELVAAQLADMAAGDLLHQLGEAQPDDGPIRALASGSYAMLDPAEATVFRRLAVVDGPARLDLIRSVVAGPTVRAARVVRILRELVGSGLVSVDRSGAHWRYRLDDDLHDYAVDLASAAGELREDFDRLAEAVRALLPEDAQAPPTPFADAVGDVLDALRGLFRGAVTGGADPSRSLELAFRLHRYWAATNVTEGRFWLAQLLDSADAGPWTPYATYALGYLDYWSGDVDRAVPELQSVVDAPEMRGTAYVARALIYLAGLLDDLDRGEEAVDHVRRAIDVAQAFGTDLQVSAAMGVGCVLAERGDPEAALHAERAMELCATGGSADQRAASLPTAAMVCYQVGDLERASRFVREARPLHDRRRIARVVLRCVEAGLALNAGDLRAAAALAEEADRDGTDLGVDRELPLVRSILARARLALGDLDDARDAAIGTLEAGLRLSYEWPLALALETAALVESDATTGGGVEDLLVAAATIRARGARPQPAPLRLPDRWQPLSTTQADAADPATTAKDALVRLRSSG